YARLELHGLASAIPRVGRAILLLEDFMRMDEELHFLSGLLLDPSRKLVLEAGRMLCRQGDLEEPSDVFHLRLGELKAHLRARGPTLRFLARRRRAEWERSRSIVPPSEIPATEAPPSLPAISDGDSRQGFPVSPGIVIGPLHVLDHLEDARDLPAGAVLLTRSPNPALVPLYPVLGGMICSTGGMLSHGFVAARELGLPAVSGIRPFGEDELSPGQWVRLDGATGRIDLLKGPPA
ncbi:MAG TPA: PEP-utilizing enzyme, partial [Bdellovibrionota bacterium]|nr:PEP-utilizing enzyme [Bdellovibrionota bacterium]